MSSVLWTVAGLACETLRCAPLWCDPHHVPGQPETLHAANHERRDVELAPGKTVEGGGGKSVMIVVPRLAKRERREPCEVARVIAGLIAAFAKEMAERVDRIGDVVQHQHAHGPTPQKAGETSRPGAANRIAEPEGREQAPDRPHEEGLVDKRDDRVG